MCLFVLTMRDVISQTGPSLSGPAVSCVAFPAVGFARCLQWLTNLGVPARTAAGCGKTQSGAADGACFPCSWICAGAEAFPGNVLAGLRGRQPPDLFTTKTKKNMQLRVFAGEETPSGRKTAFSAHKPSDWRMSDVIFDLLCSGRSGRSLHQNGWIGSVA